VCVFLWEFVCGDYSFNVRTFSTKVNCLGVTPASDIGKPSQQSCWSLLLGGGYTQDIIIVVVFWRHTHWKGSPWHNSKHLDPYSFLLLEHFMRWRVRVCVWFLLLVCCTVDCLYLVIAPYQMPVFFKVKNSNLNRVSRAFVFLLGYYSIPNWIDACIFFSNGWLNDFFSSDHLVSSFASTCDLQHIDISFSHVDHEAVNIAIILFFFRLLSHPQRVCLFWICFSWFINLLSFLAGRGRYNQSGRSEFWHLRIRIGGVFWQNKTCLVHSNLGGGFKYVLFSPLLEEDSHFD